MIANKSMKFIIYLQSMYHRQKMTQFLNFYNGQSVKLKKLGLDETDIVLDQAIEGKTTEILSNPVSSDLRKFIVLRFGAFHTTCIFLSTIGKRFADAGLKDWILESRILSMNCLFVICYFSNCENEVQQKEKNFPCVVNS